MVSFELPLEQRPHLRMMALGVHGRVPLERYHIEGFWCLHLYPYHAQISIDGVELEIKPGDLGVLPAGAHLLYRMPGLCEHLYAHFEPVASGTTWTVPALQATGVDFPQLWRLFEEAVAVFPTQSLRAEVRLWDLLWTAAQKRPTSHDDPLPAAVAEVLRQIELRLHEPLLVEALAREVGLSHNHLTRLFGKAMSKTVKGYISERRMVRARHLLQESTSPIKSIAFEVGFEDLHAFNKIVNRHFGCSPRALRCGSKS